MNNTSVLYPIQAVTDDLFI